MRWRVRVAWGISLGLCRLAFGHDVAVTAQTSRTPATADSPATASNTGSLSASWDLSEDWALDASFAVTRPDFRGDPSLIRAGNVYGISVGPSWTLGDHWLFLGSGNVSPTSTQQSVTTLTVDDNLPPAGPKEREAQLHAESTSAGAMVLASYDTAGESAWETTVTASVAANGYWTLQKLLTTDAAVDQSAAGKACLGKSSPACKALRSLLAAQKASLTQVSGTLLVTETLFSAWDAFVGATLYTYSHDPTAVGVFSVATRGTAGPAGSRSGGGTIEYGEGIALAAFRFNSQLGAAWHAHGWKVTAQQALGRYWDGGGLAASTLKVAYRINTHWKILTSFTFQRDTDSAGTVSNGNLLGATVRFSW